MTKEEAEEELKKLRGMVTEEKETSFMQMMTETAAQMARVAAMQDMGMIPMPGTPAYEELAKKVQADMEASQKGDNRPPLDFVRASMKFLGGAIKVDHAKMMEEMKRQYGDKFTQDFGTYCSTKYTPGAPPRSPQEARELELAKGSVTRLQEEVARMRQDIEEGRTAREALTTKEAELEKVQTTLREFMETFEKLKKASLIHANIVSVNEETACVSTGGRNIEVERPKKEGKLIDLQLGDTVKVTGDTMQIVEHAKDPPIAGEVLNVVRVVDGKTCEVDRQGAQRAVTYSNLDGKPLEEMDRVVLDQSATVVIKNLGKPADMGLVQEETGVCWDDIGGLDKAKRELREAIEAPILHAAKLARYGKKPAKGALLYGGPGLGKTMLGKAAATAIAELHAKVTHYCKRCQYRAPIDELMKTECVVRVVEVDNEDGTPKFDRFDMHDPGEERTKTNGGFFYVKGPAMLDKFVGETEASIRKLFAQARAYKKKHGMPAIIFIDEAEAILAPRSAGPMSQASKGFLSQTVVPQFLSEMDGLQESGAFVLLATNRPNSIDSAIVRDGRIDRRIKVTRPSKYDAASILLKHLDRTPLAMEPTEAVTTITEALYDPKNVLYRVKKASSVGKGLAMTLGHIVSGAMLAGVVDRATSLAMRRDMTEEAGEDVAHVTAEDLREAVQQVMAEARDVNHDDELNEFTEGWADEVTAVTREGAGAVQVSKDAS